MKIVLVAPFMRREDTGHHVANAFCELGHELHKFDSRTIYHKVNNIAETGVRQVKTAQLPRDELNNVKHKINERLLGVVTHVNPDLVLILKGLFISPLLIKHLKTKTFLWYFDVLPQAERAVIDLAKACNHFFTISSGSISQYKEAGVENISWLPEGCSPTVHKYIPDMTWQEKEYWGSEISFAGSVVKYARSTWLERIVKEGFNLKIWGNNPKLSTILEPHNMHRPAEAELDHSKVCSSSKIMLGRDFCPDKELSMSARLYRTLAARGFYLTNHTKGIEKLFKLKKHLVVYDGEDDCIKKMKYYLKFPREREEIAQNGEKIVRKEHKFSDRVKCMLNIFSGGGGD